MSVELITITMFACMVLFLVAGLPIAFSLGAVGIIFAFFLWGPTAIALLSSSMFTYMNNFLLVCIPLFIFMAHMLERSGIADDLYTMMHGWFGPVRGGLAMGTVVICTIFAAMSGVSAAGTLTMGVIALPAMLKRGYSKDIATGCIAAGGALGILIPPSVAMVVYCLLAQVSVGRMFLGGILPGLLLSSLFITYIGVRCSLQPSLGPALPPEERRGWGVKITSLRAVILPMILIIGVLGSIFSGMATPTEAAAVGAFGSIVSAAIYRRLNWKRLREAALGSLRTTCMVMWIIGAAATFARIYTGLGATDLIRNTIEGLGVSPLVIVIGMQFSLFLLGMFLDPNGIMLITLPIYIPIVNLLGFDPIWFGVLFVVNMEMAYLTPPVGFNLFYLKGVAPEGVTIGDIYRSIVPFVVLQATGLAIILVFPNIALYLPNLIMGK